MARLRTWLPCWCWIQIMDVALGRWIVQESTDLNTSSWPSSTWAQQSPENYPVHPENFYLRPESFPLHSRDLPLSSKKFPMIPENFSLRTENFSFRPENFRRSKERFNLRPNNGPLDPKYFLDDVRIFYEPIENSHKNTRNFIEDRKNSLRKPENLFVTSQELSRNSHASSKNSKILFMNADEIKTPCEKRKECVLKLAKKYEPNHKNTKTSARTRQSTNVSNKKLPFNDIRNFLQMLTHRKRNKQALKLGNAVNRRRKLFSISQHRKLRSRANLKKRNLKRFRFATSDQQNDYLQNFERTYSKETRASNLTAARKLPELNAPKPTSQFSNIFLKQKVHARTSSLATRSQPEPYTRNQVFEISRNNNRNAKLKGEPNLQEIDLNDASTENSGNGFDEANSSSIQAHGMDQVLSEETISVSSTALPVPSSTDVNASFSGTSLAKLWMASLGDNGGSHDDSLESFVESPAPENFSAARKREAAVGNSFNAGYENSKNYSETIPWRSYYFPVTGSFDKYLVTEPESFMKILHSDTLQPISEDTQAHKLCRNCTALIHLSLDTSALDWRDSVSGTVHHSRPVSNSLSRALISHETLSNHHRHRKREAVFFDTSVKQQLPNITPKSFRTLAPSFNLPKWNQSTFSLWIKNHSKPPSFTHTHALSVPTLTAPTLHSKPAPHRHKKRGAVYSSVVHDSRLGPGMGGSAVETFDSSGLQRFATEPAPQTAVLGSTVVLPCRVMNKVGHLQWTKDGFGLGNERRLYGFARYSMIGSDDEGDFSLRIQPVQLEDDGFFQCQVSASDGVPGIRSEEVQLTVYVPPDPPEVEPAELQTTTGLHAVLRCTSRGGRPPPEIQWIDDRHPREPLGLGAVTSMELMEDNKRSVVTSTLTFVPRRTHDNSTITCITSHQALTSPISRSARVRVQFAPEVQVSAHPPRLVEGDDAHFVCQAEANPPQLTYRWFHNSAELANQTSQTLTLPRISRDMHKDTVSCEVSNKVGASKKTLGVQVRYGPVFRSLPVDAAAEPGQEVMLKCSVDANPQPSIVWLQEGDNKIIGTGSELRVSVSPLTAGAYRCVAGVRERDLQFPELVGRMKVLLKGPPTIVSDTDQMGRPGATVNLECNTLSVPSPIKVTWTYKGKPIDLEESRYEVVEEQRNEGLRTILVIRDAEETDFGDYNCSVVNEYGIARKLIRLNEEKRIPLVLVLGCSGAVIASAGIVALCVLCSKRIRLEKASGCSCCSRSLIRPRSVSGHMHRTIRFSRDSPEPEKIISSTSGPPDMYSAGSDARSADGAPPSPSQGAQAHDCAMVNASADDADICGNNNLLDVNRAQRMKGSFMQDGTSTFSPQLRRERRDDHSVYLPLINMGAEDQDSLRRSSLSGMSASSARAGMSTARAGGSVDQRTPDFCTMRRAARGPDITLSHHHLTNNGGLSLPPDNGSVLGHHLDSCSDAAMHPPPTNGIRHSGDDFMTTCETYVRHVEGLRPAHEMNHHIVSMYSPYSPYGQSPPYPCSPLLNGGGNTSMSSRTGGLPKDRPTDADYIYSSGAVLKPGTLV